MAELRAAYRYALALLETAEEQKSVDRVSNDLQMLQELIKSSRDFLVFLRSPVISTEKKKSTLNRLLEKHIGGTTHAFILFLTSKNREMILPEIIDQFYRLHDERMGVDNAFVRSAVPLTKDQEQQLVSRLEQLTKKKIRLQPVVDARLRGGLTVQIGDTVWDGSIAHQLGVLRERFIEGTRSQS